MTDYERLKELIEKLIRGKEMMTRYDWEELIKLYPLLDHIISNHDPLVAALNDAIIHLHELTVGGEFASAIDGITISWAAGREFRLAHDAIDGFRVILAAAKGEPK